MSTQENKQQPKILQIGVLIALGFALLGTPAALYYLGAFSQPKLEKVTTPGYRLVYVNHTGPYNEIKDIFKVVETRLKEVNIPPIAAAAQFLDDPGKVSPEKLRSRVGFLIGDHEQSPPFLNDERLLSQEVIRATFDGSPIVGSYKSYAAMKEWSTENHYQLNLPSLEIYYPDGLVVYQLPISLKATKN